MDVRLRQAGITYMIGGSVASGAWGEPRHTQDIDLQAWIDRAAADRLLLVLGEEYVVGAEDITHALDSSEPHRSFQAYDLETNLKFDFFLSSGDPFNQECLEGARSVAVEGLPVPVSSPEAMVVHKLRWFVLGNRVSQLQWRDLRALAKVADVDWDWVTKWATHFGVEGDLAQLREETGR